MTVHRLFDPGPAGPEFDTMVPFALAECGVCRLQGPDGDGSYDLLEDNNCPVHGVAETVIPLWKHGQVVSQVLVDPIDYDQLAAFHWTCDKDGYGVCPSRRNGKKVTLRLHREVLGLEPGDLRQADHISGDKWDCRRSNLRVLDPGLNQQNRHGADQRSGRTSKYRGVCWNKEKGMWRATVRRVYLGDFTSEEDAARAASEYRRAHMPASVMDQNYDLVDAPGCPVHSAAEDQPQALRKAA